jgi:hypothetical protein
MSADLLDLPRSILDHYKIQESKVSIVFYHQKKLRGDFCVIEGLNNVLNQFVFANSYFFRKAFLLVRHF